jgi:hypothetical protein
MLRCPSRVWYKCPFYFCHRNHDLFFCPLSDHSSPAKDFTSLKEIEIINTKHKIFSWPFCDYNFLIFDSILYFQIGVDEITFDQFEDLLSELFHGGTITRERIVVLFFFCSDLAIRTLRLQINYFEKFIRWSLKYIAERVCAWVKDRGGWVSNNESFEFWFFLFFDSFHVAVGDPQSLSSDRRWPVLKISVFPGVSLDNLVAKLSSMINAILPGSHLGKPTKSYYYSWTIKWLDQLQILIIGASIYWGYFTVSLPEVSTMALAISFPTGSFSAPFRRV